MLKLENEKLFVLDQMSSLPVEEKNPPNTEVFLFVIQLMTQYSNICAEG
jgi:hypothetical protein